MQFDEDGHLIPWAEDKEFVHVLSYDEKPGIQATATTSEDLLPDERHSTMLWVSLTSGMASPVCKSIPASNDNVPRRLYS